MQLIVLRDVMWGATSTARPMEREVLMQSDRVSACFSVERKRLITVTCRRQMKFKSRFPSFASFVSLPFLRCARMRNERQMSLEFFHERLITRDIAKKSQGNAAILFYIRHFCVSLIIRSRCKLAVECVRGARKFLLYLPPRSFSQLACRLQQQFLCRVYTVHAYLGLKIMGYQMQPEPRNTLCARYCVSGLLAARIRNEDSMGILFPHGSRSRQAFARVKIKLRRSSGIRYSYSEFFPIFRSRSLARKHCYFAKRTKSDNQNRVTIKR